MFDRFLYENIVLQYTAIAVAANDSQRGNWEKRKAAWLDMAAIARASNLKEPGSWPTPAPPEPPALLQWVEAPPWAEGALQASIKLHVGPQRVADPACELPPLSPPNPSDVVDIGGPLPDSPGLFMRGPKDTMRWGAAVTKDGKKYRRTGLPMGWGWYEEVKG